MKRNSWQNKILKEALAVHSKCVKCVHYSAHPVNGHKHGFGSCFACYVEDRLPCVPFTYVKSLFNLKSKDDCKMYCGKTTMGRWFQSAMIQGRDATTYNDKMLAVNAIIKLHACKPYLPHADSCMAEDEIKYLVDIFKLDLEAELFKWKYIHCGILPQPNRDDRATAFLQS